MLHGTSEEASQEICQIGLSVVGTTDEGYYGQGKPFFLPFLADGVVELFTLLIVTSRNVLQ